MFMGNLALKFNVKGGGVNHTIPDIFAKPLDSASTMLMGIDVTHPSPGSSQGAPSIACMVGSIDKYLTQWPGSVRTQNGRQEMVDGLDTMVVERLRLWQKHHENALPTKIILYRDGVSEGQYGQVLTQELPSFDKAFEKLYGAKSKWPKMTVLVVGKRHHARFYATNEKDADVRDVGGQKKGSWNTEPGTVVDRHITSTVIHDYYLQAHQGLQGTVRPGHYVKLRDDIGFTANQLHEFTHNLCYMFNRATKAVSICPPAYYADLLCERGRAYLFSTLAENHGSDSSVYGAGEAEWTSGVHPNIAESTWFI
jgi:eukaryotic translation initiation factor 2C